MGNRLASSPEQTQIVGHLYVISSSQTEAVVGPYAKNLEKNASTRGICPESLPRLASQSSQSLAQVVFLDFGGVGRGLDTLCWGCASHFLVEFDASFVGDLRHESVDVFLGCTHSSSAGGGILVVSSRDIQILELRLEFVHDG
ncbi:hypothetical protein KCU68_g133, partial [Aureobasidium melanogenum]